jgi:hypothetical protein
MLVLQTSNLFLRDKSMKLNQYKQQKNNKMNDPFILSINPANF